MNLFGRIDTERGVSGGPDADQFLVATNILTLPFCDRRFVIRGTCAAQYVAATLDILHTVRHTIRQNWPSRHADD